MQVKKYEHSELVIELAGEHLIIDPGSFSMPLGDIGDVVAVVITHEHPDHWTPEQLQRILDRNPDARVFGPPGVVAAAADFEITPTKDGDVVEVGGFALAFFGEKHAVIHESIPVIDNVGVLVNDTLWYAGDSFHVPPVPVDTLAAPLGAPWLKISEAIDYVLAVAPKRAFPVHEMTLSTAGKGMHVDRLTWATEQGGGDFHALEPGETLDI